MREAEKLLLLLSYAVELFLMCNVYQMFCHFLSRGTRQNFALQRQLLPLVGQRKAMAMAS